MSDRLGIHLGVTDVLILLLIIMATVMGVMLLFSWPSTESELSGILLIFAAAGIVLLYHTHPPRQCRDVRTVEALRWDQSPFKAETNYVGSCHADGTDGYIVKVIDDYGSPLMVKMPPNHIIFLGTSTTETTLLRYDVTGWGRLISLSWAPRYVVLMNRDTISTGENDLAMKAVPVYYVGKKGISPELRWWLGSNDNAKLLGLAEAPPKETAR